MDGELHYCPGCEQPHRSKRLYCRRCVRLADQQERFERMQDDAGTWDYESPVDDPEDELPEPEVWF